MQITSWNVNSIRARLEHVLAWLDANPEVDVLCLQELKVEDSQFPLEPFLERGLHVYLYGQRTYNGVAFISRTPLEDVQVGLGDEEFDHHKRLIAATLNGVRLINVYVPNGQSPEAPAFDFKRRWYAALLNYLKTHHTPDQKVLLCGDFNVAPAPLDVWDHDELYGTTCYHPDEHEWLKTITDWGFADSMRVLYPEEKIFTWWDYRNFSFPRNRGMRIDHVLLTKPLMDVCTAVVADRAERKKEKPSDHVPVTATLAL